MFGRKSNKSSGGQKAQQCTELILSYARIVAKEIKGEEELSSKQYFILMMYSVALNYILIDRMAFSTMSGDARGDFSDQILMGLKADISSGTNIKGEMVMDLLNKFVSQLGPYSGKLFAEEDEGMGGTLFWEFAKIVSDQLELGPMSAMTGSLVAAQAGTELMTNAKSIL